MVDRIECRYFSMELALEDHGLGDLEGILRWGWDGWDGDGDGDGHGRKES